jgi:hypothetical protein
MLPRMKTHDWKHAWTLDEVAETLEVSAELHAKLWSLMLKDDQVLETPDQLFLRKNIVAKRLANFTQIEIIEMNVAFNKAHGHVAAVPIKHRVADEAAA